MWAFIQAQAGGAGENARARLVHMELSNERTSHASPNVWQCPTRQMKPAAELQDFSWLVPSRTKLRRSQLSMRHPHSIGSRHRWARASGILASDNCCRWLSQNWWILGMLVHMALLVEEGDRYVNRREHNHLEWSKCAHRGLDKITCLLEHIRYPMPWMTTQDNAER